MPEFLTLKKEMQAQFAMLLTQTEHLFLTDVPKDDLWDTYLNSFPDEINGIFRERRHYDCNYCSKFIRPYANIVGIVRNKVVSIWDFEASEPQYRPVVEALAKLVKSAPIRDVFITDVQQLGINRNTETINGTVSTWEHWFYKLPHTLVYKGSDTLDSVRGALRTGKQVFKRALDEITPESVEIALELIAQKTMYRGDQYKSQLIKFQQLQRKYKNVAEQNRDNYAWLQSQKHEYVVRIRSAAIGTFLVNVSEGMDVDTALSKFEAVMAPDNYQRPKAIFTKKMITEARETLDKLGLTESLERRHAQLSDISVDNVLFADADAEKAMAMDVFGELEKHAKKSSKPVSQVTEISVDDFIANVLPTTKHLELFLENRHQSNMVSLIAPVNKEAPSLVKWDNGFSWSYEGNMADSIKERVKRAGGNVEGYLRVSLSWSNGDDLDLHAKEPDGTHISFSNMASGNGGNLDVDMNAGSVDNRKNPVENITWNTPNRMKKGIYEISVNQYTLRDRLNFGFEVEIECQGQVWNFTHNDMLQSKETVKVVTFSWSQQEGVQIIKSIAGTAKSTDMWELDTQRMHRVSTVMFSPNHWDGQEVGNKHVFFMLDGCKNPEPVRGFFNEFLPGSLKDHRKVFEALADKMKAPVTDNQLSGVGLATTKRNDIIVKAVGATSRHLKIIF